MSELTEYRPQLVAGGKPQAIVPTTMDEAYRLAKAVCMARMAPKGLDTPEACMIAIMHGLEIGLTPLMALQRIAVVNGRPTLWGDGAMALVRASGLCEYIRETMQGEGDNRVAICEAKRKGEPAAIVRTFRVSDARKAGLWGKAGPWQQYPDRMLQMRARAFALRDGFADALGGMYLREEMDDTPPMRDVTPPPQPPRVEDPEPMPVAAEPKRRGRPKGSTNKPREDATAYAAPAEPEPVEDMVTAEEPQAEEVWQDEAAEDAPELSEYEQQLLAQARTKASQGRNSLRLYKGRLNTDDMHFLHRYLPELDAAAAEADERNFAV